MYQCGGWYITIRQPKLQFVTEMIWVWYIPIRFGIYQQEYRNWNPLNKVHLVCTIGFVTYKQDNLIKIWYVPTMIRCEYGTYHITIEPHYYVATLLRCYITKCEFVIRYYVAILEHCGASVSKQSRSLLKPRTGRNDGGMFRSVPPTEIRNGQLVPSCVWQNSLQFSAICEHAAWQVA